MLNRILGAAQTTLESVTYTLISRETMNGQSRTVLQVQTLRHRYHFGQPFRNILLPLEEDKVDLT